MSVFVDGHKLPSSVEPKSFVRDRVYLGEALDIVAKDQSGKVVFNKVYSSQSVTESDDHYGYFVIVIK